MVVEGRLGNNKRWREGQERVGEKATNEKRWKD